MPNQISREPVLAYDLGGTKVEVGVVTAAGKILTSHREPALFARGKKAVLAQLSSLGREMLRSHPEVDAVGIASAGPLDPRRGLLLDPTNFAGPDGPWGITPITRILSRALELPVTLDNDAAAALLAEHWKGAARGCANAAILTLGTGLGTAFLANGELVRGGRHLHTEAGHLTLRQGDRTARCGCGNLGCAEAYLSGNGFARWVRAQKLFPKAGATRLETAIEIANAARMGNLRARRAFHEVGTLLATLIHDISVVFSPERVVLTGSFAQAADLFLPQAEQELARLMSRRRAGIDLLPKLRISTLSNHAGLLGGAFIALKTRKRLHQP